MLERHGATVSIMKYLVRIFSFHDILLIMSGFTLSIVVTSGHVEIERTLGLVLLGM